MEHIKLLTQVVLEINKQEKIHLSKSQSVLSKLLYLFINIHHNKPHLVFVDDYTTHKNVDKMI